MTRRKFEPRSFRRGSAAARSGPSSSVERLGRENVSGKTPTTVVGCPSSVTVAPSTEADRPNRSTHSR